MKNKWIPIIIIPILIIIIGFTINNNQEKIPVQNIIPEKIIDNSETQKIKTDNEIFKEIEEKYEDLILKNNSSEYQVLPREWQTSGPFSIDRKQYALGEKIFLKIDGLATNEIGQISILRPLNQTHYSVWTTFPFDGKISESFNVYFEPRLLKLKEICNKDDLVGDWRMVFQNTNYENLKFKIMDKIVPGDEKKFSTPVC